MSGYEIFIMIGFALLITVGILVYFIPTIIAIKKELKNRLVVFVINFFFGWSLLGWVGALIWSLVGEKE